MTARILVVDDIPANVKLLEARLIAEYFDVLTAVDGFEALSICQTDQVDLILLDIMMPGMDGFEVCERLKADPHTAHIPVVMVTALDQPADRVRGLRAGADDFLTKPVNDLQLVSRVKSLLRLKALSDELRVRSEAARSFAVGEAFEDNGAEENARILLVDSRPSSQERIIKTLKPIADIMAVSDTQAALYTAGDAPFELAIVNGVADSFDPLRLCSQFRSLERTRVLPILIVAENGDDEMLVRALDLGVNDYILRPIDPNELIARCLTQIKRKRYNDLLRASLNQTIELAVTDPLTGLNNRRYLDNHLTTLFSRSMARGRPLSLVITDIDRFKSVNDAYGHAAGDEVLKEFARRLRANARGADLLCRYGGEEFVLIMPDTSEELAAAAAEKLRAAIETEPFVVASSGQSISLTASFGLAFRSASILTPHQLLNQADTALYQAKNGGRNKVVAAAA